MKSRKLSGVTLLGVDCVDISRLIQSAQICIREIDFQEVKLLTSLNSDYPNIIRIDPIDSISAYNQFVIKNLNSYVATDFVLLIQYDGFILNPDAWSDEFLEYDYIGAPWWGDGKYTVGNGGFSLRSKRLLELLQKDDSLQLQKDEPEDTFISIRMRDYLEKKGMHFAPTQLAKRFSLEANEKDGVTWVDQFGFHGLKWTDISNWTKNNPEYNIENILDSWALGVREKLKNNEN